MTDEKTIAKLMVLYLLKAVNFPLSDKQLLDFFHGKDYMEDTFFQETAAALLDANLVLRDEVRGTMRYELTREGEDALYYFGKDIPVEIVDDMDAFLKENRYQMRNETGITADYIKTDNYDFRCHMVVREGKEIIFEMNLTVPSEEQAILLCRHFEENAQAVYSGVMKQLM